MVIEAVDQGNPLIPFDLFVKKGCKGLLTFINPFESLVFRLQPAACAAGISPHRRRKRVLLDSSGAPLLSIHRCHDGSWRGFRGDSDVDAEENLVFSVERTLNTFNRIELVVKLAQLNGEESTLKMRGCVFWRSCTIYCDDFIVAQTSMMYKLGRGKIFVSRDKFRVTMFPGFSDYSVIAALISVFLDGRK